jgi:deoxycytidylate deaminase
MGAPVEFSDDDIRSHLRHCYDVAEAFSDDLSNRNAAMIVYKPPYGFICRSNRLPVGVRKTDERIKSRPTKYDFIEHAERAVIYEAARLGVITHGTTMICPWFACADCARAIVCAGIRRVIGHKQRIEMTGRGREKVVDTVSDRWVNPISNGDIILREAGVELIYFDGWVGAGEVLVNEQVVTDL